MPACQQASSDLRQMAMAEFRKEIAILKACRDVNIVQFVVSRVMSCRVMSCYRCEVRSE